MHFLKMKEHLMGTVVTGVPTVYTAGVGSSPINLIHQSPSKPLEIVQLMGNVVTGVPVQAPSIPVCL